MSYTFPLHQDDVEMVGFLQAKKPKHGYYPSLDRVRMSICLPSYLERFDVNPESHQVVQAIEQTDYPLSMKRK